MDVWEVGFFCEGWVVLVLWEGVWGGYVCCFVEDVEFFFLGKKSGKGGRLLYVKESKEVFRGWF